MLVLLAVAEAGSLRLNSPLARGPPKVPEDRGAPMGDWVLPFVPTGDLTPPSSWSELEPGVLCRPVLTLASAFLRAMVGGGCESGARVRWLDYLAQRGAGRRGGLLAEAAK